MGKSALVLACRLPGPRHVYQDATAPDFTAVIEDIFGDREEVDLKTCASRGKERNAHESADH